jgi:hypothetical protein
MNHDRIFRVLSKESRTSIASNFVSFEIIPHSQLHPMIDAEARNENSGVVDLLSDLQL